MKTSIIITKTKTTNDENKSSSVKIESSKKTSISDNELEKSVYYLDVANMEGIDILEPKDETETSYLEAVFWGFSRYFRFRFERIF